MRRLGGWALFMSWLLLPGCVGPDDLEASDPSALRATKGVRLTRLGSYATGVFDQGAAEIVSHDAQTQRLIVVNAAAATLDVLDLRDPRAPVLVRSVDMTSFGAAANSVATRRGITAVAVESVNRQEPGTVVLYDQDFAVLSAVQVGAVPDMLTFTPNGRYLLVANEGEPSADYAVDPEGSISIISLRRGAARVTQADVRTAHFRAFEAASLPAGVRLFGANHPTPAQDLEPEYIAVSHDSELAWVTLQENNALAVVDIERARVRRVVPLGFKDHGIDGKGLDPSDSDGTNLIAPWPVRGMYQPDAIATFREDGRTYLVMANEGDARAYDGLNEEARVGDLALDPAAFPDQATLKLKSTLGRLRVTNTLGDSDGDGDFDALYSFGARSFSIRSARGELVYDSGEALERTVLAAGPDFFNASNTSNARDNRSDDKGPEPEGLTVGHAYGMRLAFIGLERVGGIVTYDLSDPTSPRLLDYANFRDFTQDPANQTLTAGDLGPEGLLFIKAEDSPNGRPLLVVGNETSGSTAVYEVTLAPADFGNP